MFWWIHCVELEIMNPTESELPNWSSNKEDIAKTSLMEKYMRQGHGSQIIKLNSISEWHVKQIEEKNMVDYSYWF